MDRLGVVVKDIDDEPPEPSPQLFEISYNDDFPLARRRTNIDRFRTMSALEKVPEHQKRKFSFSSFDSISAEPEEDENRPLNHGHPSCSSDFSLKEANERLVQLLTPLYDEIYCPDTMLVRYHKMEESPLFNQFLHYSRDLQKADPATGTDDERAAFFVNIYNIMVLHMACKFGPPQDLWQRRKFLNITYYQIHEHKYALHSILNGILRSNRRGHGMLWKPFGGEDLRLPLILPKCDPLIHFCLISGTKSSPGLRVYTAENFWEMVRQNAVEYLLDDKNLLVDTKRQTLHIPKIFKWYTIDFGGSQEKCVGWILELLRDDDSEKSQGLREMVAGRDYTVEYTQFDWEFNGTDPEQEDKHTSLLNG